MPGFPFSAPDGTWRLHASRGHTPFGRTQNAHMPAQSMLPSRHALQQLQDLICSFTHARTHSSTRSLDLLARSLDRSKVHSTGFITATEAMATMDSAALTGLVLLNGAPSLFTRAMLLLKVHATQATSCAAVCRRCSRSAPRSAKRLCQLQRRTWCELACRTGLHI